MNNVDKQYIDLLKEIIENGVVKETRSGKVRSVFCRNMRFDLKEGLPLLTTKKVFVKGIIYELLWFLKGDTNIKYLVENNVNIWTDDAYRHFLDYNPQKTVNKKPYDSIDWFYTIVDSDRSLVRKYHTIKELKDDVSKELFVEYTLKGYMIEYSCYRTDRPMVETINGKEFILDGIYLYRFGNLGPIYGKGWRNYGISGFDQIKKLIETLKTNPDDRRMIITPWNVDDLHKMALPPCHLLVQFYTKEIDFNGEKKRELSCSFTMRSNDFCCGNPYNIAQYAMLTYMLCEVCDMIPGELIYHGGDVHVYENHIENAKEQMSRNGSDILPKLKFSRKINNIDDFKYEDFIIEDYYPNSPIKYQLNVG